MEEKYALCAPFLTGNGYPPPIMPYCQQHFPEWMGMVFKEKGVLEWWESRMAQDSDPFLRSAFGFWLAGQLYNRREELVQIVKKKEEPDIVSRLPDDEKETNMTAWLGWFKNKLPTLKTFLKIPDMDSKIVESLNALCSAPRAKRVRLQETTFAFFSCSLKVLETEHVIGGYYNEKVPYFAIFPLLSKIGMLSAPADKVRRLTMEEIAFLEKLPRSDLLTIFALEDNWKMQNVISKPTFDAMLESEEWKTCVKPVFIKI